MTMSANGVRPRRSLKKALTGIEGFDEVTGGGLPQGRPSLICGSAGCGKTLFAMEFLVRGATQFDEPGLFVAFEESENDLVENVASLGFELQDLVDQNLLQLDHITLDRSQMDEAGEYDLEGLFVRLGFAIDSIGAKRVVLDTIETLFGGLSNEAVLRNELQRLFGWLKEKGVTAVITAERGAGTLTRQGLEEYVSDCVILLDHRVNDQVSTRRLRVVKYRGSLHGTNEYPFLIDEDGITVMPLTSTTLDHVTSEERVPSGVAELDQMLDGLGLYRGASVLLSGTSGTGKSSLAAHFAHATCAAGERCLYFAFEESPSQILRNMRSIGLDLRRQIEADCLRIVSARPSHYGLEMHLATMLKEINRFKPSSVIIDPITTFISAGSAADAQAMLVRLVDLLKERSITAYFTSLTPGNGEMEATEIGMSSLMDTWLYVRAVEADGERNRLLYVLKSRGMPHSNQVREFLITRQGIRLTDVYLGPQGVLTGSARIAREERERADSAAAKLQAQKDQAMADRRAEAIEAQIAVLRAQLQAERLESWQIQQNREALELEESASREAMAKSRGSQSPVRELV
jgi:circadian clock protein KaiC